ncbi:hypothetical protein BH10CYA1_BH10CYA1_42380 [soil metagenome]
MQTKREFFTNGQLMLIQSVAYICAEPYDGPTTSSDEMAVYDLISQYTHGWTAEQLEVIKSCAQECEREKSGAVSVFDKVNAYNGAAESPQ